jgi:TonB family protein
MDAAGHRRPLAWQGWAVGLALALLVNAAVPLLLSRLSRGHHTIDAPLPTRRLAKQPDPPTAPAAAPAAGETVATTSAQVAQVPLPALDLPSIQPLDAAISVPAIGGVDDLGDLPMVVPAVAVAGPLSGGVASAMGAGDGTAGYDQPPQRLTDLDLARFYPRIPKLRGVTGVSRVRLTIATDGSVSAVAVLRSTPTGIFERAAEELGLAQRYLPARKGTRAVSALVTFDIIWDMKR